MEKLGGCHNSTFFFINTLDRSCNLCENRNNNLAILIRREKKIESFDGMILNFLFIFMQA